MPLMFHYGRAKLAEVAVAHYLAKKEPSISVVSLHPGSILSNFGTNAGGWLAQLSYYISYPFQYGPSQGAGAALRASLDPAFNTVAELQGAYLHCDGNPWAKASLTIEDPDTKKPYDWDKYSETVVTLTNELIAKLLK